MNIVDLLSERKLNLILIAFFTTVLGSCSVFKLFGSVSITSSLISGVSGSASTSNLNPFGTKYSSSFNALTTIRTFRNPSNSPGISISSFSSIDVPD